MNHTNHSEEELKPVDDEFGKQLVNLVDEFFPKGKCKERGEAIVLVAKAYITANDHYYQLFLSIIEQARHIDMYGKPSQFARYDGGGQPVVYLSELRKKLSEHFNREEG